MSGRRTWATATVNGDMTKRSRGDLVAKESDVVNVVSHPANTPEAEGEDEEEEGARIGSLDSSGCGEEEIHTGEGVEECRNRRARSARGGNQATVAIATTRQVTNGGRRSRRRLRRTVSYSVVLGETPGLTGIDLE